MPSPIVHVVHSTNSESLPQDFLKMPLLATNIKAMAKKFALQCNTIYQIGIVFDRSYGGMAAELPLLEC